MAVYEYIAKDRSGERFSSTYSEVDNVREIRNDLDKAGYELLKVKRKKSIERQRRKIKQSEVVNFTYKFAGMYSAGLSILQCLETLQEQTKNEALQQVIADITESIETGSSLKKAFSKYRHIFSDFFIGMIEAGETGGKLATTLQMSAVYLEKRADLKQRIKSAFVYPAVVTIMCCIIVGFLLVFFVPVFSKLYDQLKVTLPGPTLVLVALSRLLRNFWPVIVIAAAAAVISVKFLFKNKNVRRTWDAFKLNMPIFGRLNRMTAVTNFIRSFAILASVGVPLTRALEVAALVAQNDKVAEISSEMQGAIEAGHSVADSLKNYKIFPPIIHQLAASGEKSGKLAEMLDKGAEFLDKDIERTVHALLAKLEPTLTVIMGVIVGFVLLSVYLPMFDYMAHLK